jgi:hypothetical protein
MSLYHCMASFHCSPYVMCFVCNKPEVKFMHSSNHTEHYRKWLYYLTRTKSDCTSAQSIFNKNTVVTSQKQRSAFPSANNCQGQLQTPQCLSVPDLHVSRGSSVTTFTTLREEGPESQRSQPGSDKTISSSERWSDFWGPPSLLSDCYRGLLRQG